MKKGILSTFFVGLTMLAMAGHAEEVCQQDEASNNEKVVVGSRPLCTQTREQMESDRQMESEQYDESSGEKSTELGVLIIPIKAHNLFTLASNQLNVTSATVSTPTYHWIQDFPNESLINIEDGSEWVFDTDDSPILSTWSVGDDVVVSPQTQMPWGSSYEYVMTNKDQGNSVSVSLFRGPIKFGTQSTWMITFNQALGQVYLANGQGDRVVWEVSKLDMDLLKDWQQNDTVIIGENDSWLWWFSSYRNILINVNMNHYVRAKMISLN